VANGKLNIGKHVLTLSEFTVFGHTFRETIWILVKEDQVYYFRDDRFSEVQKDEKFSDRTFWITACIVNGAKARVQQ